MRKPDPNPKSKLKRRIRSPHPGVVLLKRTLPSGLVVWQARYVDPDSGKLKKPLLDSAGLPNHEARTLWAKKKSKAIAKRRMELEAGAPTKTHTTFEDALSAYRESAEKLLRASTLGTYEQAFAWLRRWASDRGLDHVESLTPPLLADLKDALVAGDKRVVKKGARRGTRTSSAARRSPVTVNTYLKNIKLVLNHLRARGLTPGLSKDAIGDALKPLPVPREQAEYLTPAKISKLLEAAQRHDAETYVETREEHLGLRERGTTPRYTPIFPFTMFLLLTGCRRGEALGLKWEDVDLGAVDSQGNVVGEIRLRAADTKTKHARTIGLEVSPALRAMLAAMKLKAADEPFVFGGKTAYTVDVVETARARMISEAGEDGRPTFGAPKFDWQMLRSTCATYLTNAQGIFGSATVFLSARQLGHSVTVAERHYLNVHRGIPREARTLEAAMQIEKVMQVATAAPAGTRSLADDQGRQIYSVQHAK